MDIEDIIILSVVSFLLNSVGLFMLTAGFDHIFSFYFRFNKFRIKKFQWIKTKAKIVNIETFSTIRARSAHNKTSSFTVVYYDKNVRYKSHILNPVNVIKGKYVYIYYKKNKPHIIREVRRPTPRNIPLALIFFMFAAVSFGFGIFLASELIF